MLKITYDIISSNVNKILVDSKKNVFCHRDKTSEEKNLVCCCKAVIVYKVSGVLVLLLLNWFDEN